jgi:hypothetical protein
MPSIELNDNDQATIFQQAIPQGQHNITMVIDPAPGYGGILKQLKDTIEAERSPQTQVKTLLYHLM